MDRVITVHGIWTTGKWQENIAPVLWPHFEPVSVKYPYYRWLGPLDLVFEPLLLFPGAAFLVLAIQLSWIRSYFAIVPLWSALLALSYWITRFRRQKVLGTFIEETAHTTLPGRAPHIIAHSFGTYLTARALREFGPTKSDRVVLTGCVLHRNFDWAALLSKKEGVFKAIRNDVGRKDLPVFLAGFLQRSLPDFGSAGRYGFRSTSGSIHDVSQCGSSCKPCEAGAQALVHNIFNDHGGHSTTFLGPGYAANYWLPFFWGIDPKEYDDFSKLCWAVTNYEALRPKLKQPGVRPSEPSALFEAELYSRKWGWAAGTFAGYVETQILKDHPEYKQDQNHLDDLVFSATVGVCQAVADAMDAQSTKLAVRRKSEKERRDYTSAEDVRIVALNPLEAVKRALEELYAQERGSS